MNIVAVFYTSIGKIYPESYDWLILITCQPILGYFMLTPSLPLLPGPLWSRVVASNRLLSMGQIELFDI